MKKLSFLLFAMLLVSCGGGGGGAGGDGAGGGPKYHVRSDGTVASDNVADATGCDNAETALDMAQFNATTFSAGDTVIFCTEGGNYTTPMIPISNGTAESRITYEGDADNDKTYAHITGVDGFCVYIIDAGNYSTFQHFELSSCTEGVTGWAKTTMIYGTKFLYNWIHDMTNRGMLISGGADAEDIAHYFDGIEIAYNHIYANGTDTIGADIALSRFSTNTHIHHNTLYGTTSKGVDGVVSEYIGGGNIIEYNTIYNHNNPEFGEDGIDVKHAYSRTPTEAFAYNVIRNNTIYGHLMQTGITVQMGSRNVKIYNNHIYNNNWGVWVRGPYDNVTANVDINYNVIDNNKITGIKSDSTYTDNVTIYNNTIVNNGGDGAIPANTGICITDGKNYIIKNNILSNNRPSLSSGYRLQLYIKDGVEDTTTLDYNLYYHPAGTVDVFLDNAYRKLATIKSTYNQETNGLEADPLFLSSFDYNLTYSSPAVDKGVTIDGITSDYKGKLVPRGLATDIGAYEY